MQSLLLSVTGTQVEERQPLSPSFSPLHTGVCPLKTREGNIEQSKTVGEYSRPETWWEDKRYYLNSVEA